MADEPTYRSNQPIGNPQGITENSPDASQEVAQRGMFDTYQTGILDRMIELTRDQNPDWDYVYADENTAIPNDYPLDTMLDVAGGAGVPAPHNILSATHTDSTANAVLRGAIITGQGVAPTWARLNAGGIGTVLTMGVAEPAWGALPVDPDIYAKVSAADTTASYLNTKILAGAGLSKAIGTPGGNETLDLACTITQYTDEMAQDACFAFGTSLVTATIAPTYNDVANTMSWDVRGNSITATEIMTIATDSLLGRDTPLAGNVEVIAIGAGMAMSGAQVLNDVLATTEIIPPVSRTIPTNYHVVTYGSYELTGAIALTIEGTGGMFIA